MARPPNIVVILTDDQGFADAACYGASDLATPHLDRLAAEGVRFTNFHVAHAVCSASRAALLTGCYANRLGINGALFPDSKHGLAGEESTLPELLRAQGYATGMAGKWHLGHLPPFLPDRHGFDESCGIPYSNDMWPHHPEAAPGTFPPLPYFEDGRISDPEIDPEEMADLTTRFTERAVSFIERNRNRPFFFYLAHPMPHVPLAVSGKFKGRSKRGLFGDVIMEIDWSVGEILRALSRCGLERDTLVIFTSDNGPWLSYGDHAGSAGKFREGKGTSWEGGTRVPCLMRWPGHLPAGMVNDRFFVSIDLLPSIVGVVGALPPALPIDGRDVWPLLAGRPGAENPHAGYGFWYAENELQAVVSGDGRWKRVYPHRYRTLAGEPGGSGGKPVPYRHSDVTAAQLYDLKHDPGETMDVAGSNPQIARDLDEFARACRAELGDALTGSPGRANRPPGRFGRSSAANSSSAP